MAKFKRKKSASKIDHYDIELARQPIITIVSSRLKRRQQKNQSWLRSLVDCMITVTVTFDILMALSIAFRAIGPVAIANRSLDRIIMICYSLNKLYTVGPRRNNNKIDRPNRRPSDRPPLRSPDRYGSNDDEDDDDDE